MNRPAPTAAVLARYPISGRIPTDLARAAVLAVLRDCENEPEVLLIRRTEQADDPASGQIGLPGGGVDSEDSGLEDTALRETSEEVGIDAMDLAEPPRFVRLGWVRRNRDPVAIFVAPLKATARAPRIASPAEVAEVFWMPRSAFQRVDRVSVATTRGMREVEATRDERHVVWGFTWKALRDLFGFAPT